MKKEEQLIEAAKYGYNYHVYTKFPNKPFEENCKNNFLQWLSSKQYHYSNDSVVIDKNLLFKDILKLVKKYIPVLHHNSEPKNLADAILIKVQSHLQKQQESDAVAFFEWIVSDECPYESVNAFGRNRWIDINKNYIDGNSKEIDREELVIKYGITTKELYQLFKSNNDGNAK